MNNPTITKVEREVSKLTFNIESLSLDQHKEEVHAELADLYFERAELYFKSERFQWAIDDYTLCLDFNPYFYEADMGREMVYLAMKEGMAAVAA